MNSIEKFIIWVLLYSFIISAAVVISLITKLLITLLGMYTTVAILLIIAAILFSITLSLMMRE